MCAKRENKNRATTGSAITLLVAAACAATEPEPTVPVQPLGTTHVAPAGTMPPDTRPPVPVEIPAELERLVVAVDGLSEGPNLSHEGIIRAFRELADASELYAPRRIADLEAMQRAARELARSPDEAMNHAEMAQSGLQAAVRLFAATRPWRTELLAEYGRVVCLLALATDEVDGYEPLMQEHEHVVAAFEAATRALHLGIGLPDPGGPMDRCDIEVRSFPPLE